MLLLALLLYLDENYKKILQEKIQTKLNNQVKLTKLNNFNKMTDIFSVDLYNQLLAQVLTSQTLSPPKQLVALQMVMN